MSAQPPVPEGLGSIARGVVNMFGGVFGVALIAGAGLILFILILLLRKKGGSHPFARRINEWFSTLMPSMLGILVDPSTKQARLVPLKRLGSVYVYPDEGVIVLPVAGGEVYTHVDTGKPLIFGLRYGRFASQWSPGQDQVLALSLSAFKDVSNVTSIEELEDMIIGEIMSDVSKASNEIVLSPNLKLYVSANLPRVLEQLRYKTSVAVASVASSLENSAQAIDETGIQLIRERTRQMAVRWQSIATVIAVAGAIAVVMMILLPKIL